MNLIRVAQKAFIRNKENKVLLVKFSKYLPDKKIWGTWDMPGGGLYFGENLKKSLGREIKEEVNLKVKQGPVVAVWDWMSCVKPKKWQYQSVNENNYHAVVIAYDAKYISGKIKFDHEHDACKWIDPNDWEKYDTAFEKMKNRSIWEQYLEWYKSRFKK